MKIAFLARTKKCLAPPPLGTTARPITRGKRNRFISARCEGKDWLARVSQDRRPERDFGPTPGPSGPTPDLTDDIRNAVSANLPEPYANDSPATAKYVRQLFMVAATVFLQTQVTTAIRVLAGRSRRRRRVRHAWTVYADNKFTRTSTREQHLIDSKQLAWHTPPPNPYHSVRRLYKSSYEITPVSHRHRCRPKQMFRRKSASLAPKAVTMAKRVFKPSVSVTRDHSVHRTRIFSFRKRFLYSRIARKTSVGESVFRIRFAH